jgi:hypothetical protein
MVLGVFVAEVFVIVKVSPSSPEITRLGPRPTMELGGALEQSISNASGVAVAAHASSEATTVNDVTTKTAVAAARNALTS